jgi:hypothetical protein
MKGKPDHLLEDVMMAATARDYSLKLATPTNAALPSLGIGIVNPSKSGA